MKNSTDFRLFYLAQNFLVYRQNWCYGSLAILIKWQKGFLKNKKYYFGIGNKTKVSMKLKQYYRWILNSAEMTEKYCTVNAFFFRQKCTKIEFPRL